jgi:zinc protease
LESTASEPITADELQRAKAKWLKSWELTFTNPEQVGLALSESIAQGDWRLFFLLRDRVRDAKLATCSGWRRSTCCPTNARWAPTCPATRRSARPSRWTSTWPRR